MRVAAILPRLGGHEPRLRRPWPVDDGAAQELMCIACEHLDQVHKRLVDSEPGDGKRTHTLLAYHDITSMWMEELADRPHPVALGASGIEHAVFDTAHALLLWHVVDSFYRTQRLVQFCLLALADGVVTPMSAARPAAPWEPAGATEPWPRESGRLDPDADGGHVSLASTPWGPDARRGYATDSFTDRAGRHGR